MPKPSIAESNAITKFTTIIIVLAVGIPVAISLNINPMTRLEDDFYYYFVVAKNFIATGSCTFDGINLTNGFHPLWLLIVSIIYDLSSRSDSNTINNVYYVSCLFPFIGALGVAEFIKNGLPESSPIGRLSISILYGATSLMLSTPGMEVSLTLALFPWVLARQTAGLHCRMDALTYTLLTCIVVLSRIDSVLILGPIWVYSMERYFRWDHATHGRNLGNWLTRNFFWVLAGALPFIAYELMNLIYFGGLLPQSATAKSMKIANGPFAATFSIFYASRSGTGLAFLYVGCLSIWCRGLFCTKKNDLIPFGIVLWPAIFYSILMFQSSWRLWVWYLYPLVTCLPAAYVILDGLPSWRRLGNAAVVAVSVFYLVMVTGATIMRLKYNSSEFSIFTTAKHLREFAATHPGRYAMGDRAGTVGYLIGQPLMQLEGLVGGAKVIDAIREQRDLLAFLRENGIGYYIVTDLTKTADGCYAATEPQQGGPGARHMRAMLCFEPVMQFSATRLPIEGNDIPTLHTLVFKLDP